MKWAGSHSFVSVKKATVGSLGRQLMGIVARPVETVARNCILHQEFREQELVRADNVHHLDFFRPSSRSAALPTQTHISIKHCIITDRTHARTSNFHSTQHFLISAAFAASLWLFVCTQTLIPIEGRYGSYFTKSATAQAIDLILLPALHLGPKWVETFDSLVIGCWNNHPELFFAVRAELEPN